MPSKGSPIVNLRVSIDERDRLDALSDETGVPKSHIVKMALRRYLDEHGVSVFEVEKYRLRKAKGETREQRQLRALDQRRRRDSNPRRGIAA